MELSLFLSFVGGVYEGLKEVGLTAKLHTNPESFNFEIQSV